MQLDEQSENVESGEGGVIDSHWSSLMECYRSDEANVSLLLRSTPSLRCLVE